MESVEPVFLNNSIDTGNFKPGLINKSDMESSEPGLMDIGYPKPGLINESDMESSEPGLVDIGHPKPELINESDMESSEPGLMDTNDKFEMDNKYNMGHPKPELILCKADKEPAKPGSSKLELAEVKHDIGPSKTVLRAFKCVFCGAYKNTFTSYLWHKYRHKKKYLATKHICLKSKIMNRNKGIRLKRRKTFVYVHDADVMSTNAEETTYKCEKCRQCFTEPSNLIAHFQRSHNDGTLCNCAQKTQDDVNFTPKGAQKTCDAKGYTPKSAQKTHVTDAADTPNRVQKAADLALKTVQKIIYKCHKCHKCFSDLNKLMWHMQVSHNSKKAKVRIEKSKTFLSTQKHKIIDLTSSEGNHETTYKCDKCNRCYSHLNNLICHIQISHTINRRKTLSSKQKKSSKRRGVQKTHGGAAFTPNSSPKRHGVDVTTKSAQKRHGGVDFTIKSVQNAPDATDFTPNSAQKTHDSANYAPTSDQEIAYKCEKCHQSFTELNKLVVHFHTSHHDGARCNCAQKTHDVDSSMDCVQKTPDVVDFTPNSAQETMGDVDFTPNSASKTRGVVDITPNIAPNTGDGADLSFSSEQKTSYKCEQCYRGFDDLNNFTAHLISHCQKVKVQKQFQCSSCDKHFATKSALEYHVKTHEEKKYECNICHERFTYVGIYQEHVKLHPKEKTYQCQQCLKSFATPSEYVWHTCTENVPEMKPYSCQCSYCGKSFSFDDDLERHVLTHTKEKVIRKFQCQICGKVLRENNRAVHMRIHSKEKPFLCEWCGMPFSRRDNLHKHYLTHTKEKPYECKHCHTLFPALDILTHHVTFCSRAQKTKVVAFKPKRARKTTPNRADKTPTPTHDAVNLASNCVKKAPVGVNVGNNKAQNRPKVVDFTPNSAQKRHDDAGFTPNKEQETYKCDKCHRCFSDLINLVSHFQTSHYDRTVRTTRYGRKVKTPHYDKKVKRQNQFGCSSCEKQFATKSALEYHVKTHGEKKYECSICHERFTYLGLYQEHVKLHPPAKKKAYQCQYCEACFATPTECVLHEEIHSGLPKKKPYTCQCPYCGKTFRWDDDLDKHIVTHTREKIKTFKCEVCHKTLVANNRSAHMRIHNNDKPFLCEWCGMPFSRLDNMQRHFLTHTKEKPFECQYCHTRFTQLGSMRQHIKAYCKEKPLYCNM